MPPDTNISDNQFLVSDVKIGADDLTGRSIEEIYIRVRPKYAVYRTADRVVVQYADDETLAAEQRKNMSSLNLARAQINGLISDWNKSKHSSAKEKSTKYDARVASALILCLEGDSVTALTTLNDIKADILSERTSWGCSEYLISTSIISFLSIIVLTIMQHYVYPFSSPSGNIWLTARAGIVGAFFSIALAIQNRTVLTTLHRRDNITDAALRILIGMIGAGVLMLMLSSNVLPSFRIGDAAISGAQITWQTALVVGFVAGFLERLVPDLLEKAAAAQIDKAADKATADKAAADKAAADKAAAGQSSGRSR